MSWLPGNAVKEKQMGRFSTTIHIKSHTDRTEFVNSLCDMMKKQGFAPCSKDEAAQSYLLAFSDSGWVTFTSEEYADNSAKADEDAVRIGSELKLSGFVAEIVDSDFAILGLFGGKSDRVIVGDGSGYGIEDAPKGNGEYWKPLLSNGKTWEQLSEIWEKNDVFVEDTLCESAPLFGIEPQYMVADYRELSDNAERDNNIVPLYFNTKKKAMSLNTAFVKVFGEGLEPLGFRRLKKVKSKQPYFVRVVGGEILHIISYRTITSQKLGHKCVEVLGGAATLYRRNLDFTMRPEDWLTLPIHLFRAFPNIEVEPAVMESAVQYDCDLWGTDKDIIVKRETLKGAFSSCIGHFLCRADDSEAMIRGLENAFNVTKSVILGVLDKVTDLSSCIDYFYKAVQRLGGWMGLCSFDEFVTSERYSYSEGLILIKAGYRDDGKERIKNEAAAMIPSLGRKASPEDIEKFLKEYVERNEPYRAEQVALRNEMQDDPELNKRVMEEMERCRANNIEMLKSYGIADTQ